MNFDQQALFKFLGALQELAGYRPEKKVSPHFTGKHAGAKQKPKNWHAHKIIKRKIAEASRKRNRK